MSESHSPVRTGGDDPFRGRGTPSCYHLDIAGRLISPIASGAESVLAMASELAGVDPMSLLDDPLSDPAPAGTRYLLADNGACAPSSGSGPVTTWAGTRTYRLGDFHFGLRYDSDSTAGVLDARTLALLAPGAAVVNVARGGHIVTDDLVAALRSGQVGSAGLDVTDPEPLPEGHPLWALPNVIITPHVGNTPEMAVPLLSARMAANVRRWASGEPLIGVVDPDAGY